MRRRYLSAFLVALLTHAASAQSLDRFVNELVDRMLKSPSLNHGDVDSALVAKTHPHQNYGASCAKLGKADHLPIPSWTTPRHVSPLHTIPHCDSLFSRIDHIQQYQTQVRAEEGYKFGDFTKKAFAKAQEAVTEAGKQYTGNDNYKFGDITKGAAQKAKKAADAAGKVIMANEQYEFGDITKGAAQRAKKAADAAGKVVMANDQYEFGDLTKGALKGAMGLIDIGTNPTDDQEKGAVSSSDSQKEETPTATTLATASTSSSLVGSLAFDADTAVLLSGFAFEAYNEPSERDARWERGADGTDVAFMSDVFAQECYAGRLEVVLHEAKDLPEEDQASEKLISGSEPDPYVMFALNEESPEGPKEGAMALVRAVDRARSSTRWARDAPPGEKKGYAKWGEEERFYLYVKEPSDAQLALTVFDEDMLKEDDPLGAASVKLSSLLSFNGTETQRSWSGWIPLTWRPEETQDNTVMMGSMAGMMVAGPMGAAAGGFIGSLIKKPVRGEVRVELKYTPLDPSTKVLTKADRTSPIDALQDSQATGTSFKLSNGVAPRGASEGVDWSELVRYAGVSADAFELLCFVSHDSTSTQAAMWRDRATRRVVLSFRGTSDLEDALTDIKLQQVPLEERDDGKESDDHRFVHSGFKASAISINRRLKELLVSACIGTPGEWEVLVTGHSLGGALATLMTAEIAEGVDTSRSLKTRGDNSWFGQLVRAAQNTVGMVEAKFDAIRIGRVRMYTFGQPRVGDSAFAAYFNSLGVDTYRLVNGADIVPRMPRHANSAGAILDYEHVGRTVLISDGEEGSPEVSNGFWIEGESDGAACPLRDVSPFTNPFGPKTIIGDLGECVTSSAAAAMDKINVTDVGTAARSLWEAAAELDKGKGDLQSRLESMTPLEAVTVLGLDARFVRSEMDMLASLKRGTFVEHHLEPSYFKAMKNAIRAPSEKSTG